MKLGYVMQHDIGNLRWLDLKSKLRVQGTSNLYMKGGKEGEVLLSMYHKCV